MKKLFLILFCSCSLGYVHDILANKIPPLHLVNFNLQAEEWAKTSTARVIVSFNGTVSEDKLADLHTEVIENLKKIYQSDDWHITLFRRQKDQSGLEKVFIRTEIRMPEKALANLRKKAHDISKPGATFKIENVLFSPSLEDIEQTKTELRNKIYHLAKIELVNLNSIYSKQKYQLHQITFDGFRPIPIQRRETVLAVGAKQDVVQPIEVSQKIILTASVQFASDTMVK